MIDKTTLKKNFITGALSIFRLGRVPMKNFNDHQIDQYIWHVCDDLNTAYSKLKKEHERN